MCSAWKSFNNNVIISNNQCYCCFLNRLNVPIFTLFLLSWASLASLAWRLQANMMCSWWAGSYFTLWLLQISGRMNAEARQLLVKIRKYSSTWNWNRYFNVTRSPLFCFNWIFPSWCSGWVHRSKMKLNYSAGFSLQLVESKFSITNKNWASQFCICVSGYVHTRFVFFLKSHFSVSAPCQKQSGSSAFCSTSMLLFTPLLRLVFFF